MIDPTTVRVLIQVGDERAKQDTKWGEQNHPDADAVILARLDGGDAYADPAAVAWRLADEHGIPTAARAKFICRAKARRGEVTWADILTEEVAELVESIVTRDPATIRGELTQVAAVAVAWIEAIDRRAP